MRAEDIKVGMWVRDPGGDGVETVGSQAADPAALSGNPVALSGKPDALSGNIGANSTCLHSDPRLKADEAFVFSRPVPKPKTARSKDYLAHVRTFPCCSCGATEAIHAHHVASGGMGAKASDYLAAPLCGVCHQHWHATATLPLGDVNSGMRRLRSAAVLWEAAARCLEEWITREGE